MLPAVTPGALLLLAAATFCGIGFLATFEPTDNLAQFIYFTIGFDWIGSGCLVGVGFLVMNATRDKIQLTRFPVDQQIVNKLEREMEEATAEAIMKMGLKRLPSHQTMHFMSKATVAVYGTSVENDQQR